MEGGLRIGRPGALRGAGPLKRARDAGGAGRRWIGKAGARHVLRLQASAECWRHGTSHTTRQRSLG
eukprot:9238489-Lingulodinium_polyedra.AAC.1